MPPLLLSDVDDSSSDDEEPPALVDARSSGALSLHCLTGVRGVHVCDIF